MEPGLAVAAERSGSRGPEVIERADTLGMDRSWTGRKTILTGLASLALVASLGAALALALRAPSAPCQPETRERKPLRQPNLRPFDPKTTSDRLLRGLKRGPSFQQRSPSRSRPPTLALG